MTLAAGTRLALRQAQGDLEQGRKVGPYDIQAAIDAGGPAFARAEVTRELRRGLAVAQQRPRP